MTDTLNAEALKKILWDTMKNVSTKQISVVRANALAAQSRELMRVVRHQLEVSKLSGADPGKRIISQLSSENE